MTTCQTRRVNEVDSIAVGPQEVPFVCGRVATVKVLLHGAVYGMCERCASEAIDQLGGKKLDPEAAVARLDSLHTELLDAAAELAGWPDVAEWLEQAALGVRQMASDFPRSE